MSSTSSAQVQGGGFLVTDYDLNQIFTPEDFSEEQRMILEMCDDFLEKEVLPNVEALDRQESGLMEQLLNKAGELGLLGAAFPEDLGGLGKDFVTATLINERLGGGHSFAVAMAAHNGIGSLPILYFGTDEQKQHYIPRLASGEMKGAYALTEPGSGSDALGARTTATLTADGKFYLLNGQKIWITNAGFADVFTVFAKVDGDKFTAFIVDRNTPGLTIGEEEHKMGIKGSSTRPLFFEDCKVPAGQLLGEVGRGHIIAFNILNIGRLKLCAAALGGAKQALAGTIRYAKNREQFKTSIANFGAIQHKLGEMIIRTFAAESVLYRTSGWIDSMEQQLTSGGKPHNETLLAAAEEFAIECAMLKVIGSEALDYVVDEGVQIHGGNGFMDDYNISRSYRDSRINRIFEGTNEINRLLTLDMFLKRAMKNRVNLMGPALSVSKELMSIPDFSSDDQPFSEELKAVRNFKKAILLSAGAAVQRLAMKISDEQEILLYLADMLNDAFQAESMLHRTIKMQENNHPHSALALDATRVFLADAADRILHAGKNAVQSFAEGDEQRMLLMGLRRFTKLTPFNTKEARRRLAKSAIDRESYIFS